MQSKTPALCVLAMLASAAACSTPGADHAIQERYLRGDYQGAATLVDRDGYGEDDSLQESHFLDAMNRGMIGLAVSDASTARHNLERGALHYRHLSLSPTDTAADVVNEVTSVLGDDFALDYTVLPYELTVAESLAGLSNALRADISDRKNGLDQARNYARTGSSRSIAQWSQEFFDDATNEKLGGDYKVDHTHTGLAHFVYGTTIEHQDRAQAEKLFERAHQIEDLPGIEMHCGRGAPPPGTQPVWVYVLEGPGATKVREDLRAGVEVETLLRYFWLIAKPKRNIADFIAAITNKTFPIPARSFIDTAIGGVEVRVDGASDGRLVPVIADVSRAARESFELDRDIRIARQIVRTAVKDVSEGVVTNNANDLLSGLTTTANTTSKFFERADVRGWATMPARVRALRLDLAPGTHRLEIAVEPSGAQVAIAGRELGGEQGQREVPTRRTVSIELPDGGLPAFVVAVVPSALSVGEIGTNCPAAAGAAAVAGAEAVAAKPAEPAPDSAPAQVAPSRSRGAR